MVDYCFDREIRIELRVHVSVGVCQANGWSDTCPANYCFVSAPFCVSYTLFQVILLLKRVWAKCAVRCMLIRFYEFMIDEYVVWMWSSMFRCVTNTFVRAI